MPLSNISKTEQQKTKITSQDIVWIGLEYIVIVAQKEYTCVK